MTAPRHPVTAVQPGTLYVCGTPIGNLDDLSLRAAAVLAAADLVLAEDTRRARKLASRHPLGGRLVSCHAHNEAARGAEVVAALSQGAVVALITDAGTPGLSDPGAQLVAAVAAGGYPVIPVPGPNAVAAALSVSGFATASFHFLGFFPRARRQRKATVEFLSLVETVAVFFEAPARIVGTIELLAAAFPTRLVVVAREMTKRHETYTRGPLVEIARQMRVTTPKGEYTVVLGPAADRPDGPDDGQGGSQTAQVAVEVLHQEVALLTSAGLAELEAIRRVARGHGLSRQAVYLIIRGG